MRSTYRVFAYLVAGGVLFQVASVAYAWFAVIQDLDAGEVFDKNAANPGHFAHGLAGMAVIPLVALTFLILSFFARIPGGVAWAAITFGVTVLQVALAFVAFSAPVVGPLHGLNAIVLLVVAVLAARRARPAPVAAPQPVTVAAGA
jgi:hypothetical protein